MQEPCPEAPGEMDPSISVWPLKDTGIPSVKGWLLCCWLTCPHLEQSNGHPALGTPEALSLDSPIGRDPFIPPKSRSSCPWPRWQASCCPVTPAGILSLTNSSAVPATEQSWQPLPSLPRHQPLGLHPRSYSIWAPSAYPLSSHSCHSNKWQLQTLLRCDTLKYNYSITMIIDYYFILQG